MNHALVRLAYFGRTAFRGLLASPVTSAVSVTTIAVSLVMVGAFELLSDNMEEILDRFGDDLRVTAYLEEGIPDDERQALAASAAAVPGVVRVEPVTKEEALERFRSGVGSGAALLEGLEENPLPASLEIVLEPEIDSREGLSRVLREVAALRGVADVGSGAEWVDGYLRAAAVVRGAGVVLGAILMLATLLIVANTIRLAVVARRDELEILALVGAGRTFLTTPFLLEGVMQGAAGGTLALLLLYALFRLVLPGFEFGLELLLGGASPRFFTSAEALGIVFGGAGLGLFGSAAAVSGGLRS